MDVHHPSSASSNHRYFCDIYWPLNTLSCSTNTAEIPSVLVKSKVIHNTSLEVLPQRQDVQHGRCPTSGLHSIGTAAAVVLQISEGEITSPVKALPTSKRRASRDIHFFPDKEELHVIIRIGQVGIDASQHLLTRRRRISCNFCIEFFSGECSSTDGRENVACRSNGSECGESVAWRFHDVLEGTM